MGRKPMAIVDCDVHNALPSAATLQKYMDEKWWAYRQKFGGIYPSLSYPRTVKNAARLDAWPPSGGPPGSDLAFTQHQLLDEWGIGCVLLGPLIRAQSGCHNCDYAAAVASAVNDWTQAEWLDQDDRFVASIVTPYEDGGLAAAEISRLSSDKRFVQVYLNVRTEKPLGHRKYWPIYEAAVHHHLPVGVHFGGINGSAVTGAGWPSYYFEDHCGNSQSFQAQVSSLVCEGVFERFPELRIVLIEGGFAWVPSLAWRLDRAARLFGGELPMLERRPSEYISDHIWFTTQPIEEPEVPSDLGRLIESFPNLENRLMFSTDYPHWDFDSPGEVLKKSRLSDGTKAKIFSHNACDLYSLW